MSQFRAFQADSGNHTAIHAERNVLIHSAVDPVCEAQRLADDIARGGAHPVFLIGCGLGYFMRELDKRNLLAGCFEPFNELASLALNSKTDVTPTGDSAMRVGAAEELRTAMRKAPVPHQVVIASYVLALQSELPLDLEELIRELHVLTQSQRLYSPLIAYNLNRNKGQLDKLPRLNLADWQSDTVGIAVGAGPSLDKCMPLLQSYRSKLNIIAASGAMPALCSSGVTPDWIVALEARETILADLEVMPAQSKLVAFQWTHPEVFQMPQRVFVADEGCLWTGGGSSGLTAADLAIKLTDREVCLVGMELGDSSGEYAANTLRVTANRAIGAPKFAVMRAAAQEWVALHPRREICQVTCDGKATVRGMSGLTLSEFEHKLRVLQNSKVSAEES